MNHVIKENPHKPPDFVLSEKAIFQLFLNTAGDEFINKVFLYDFPP